jgi:hypothetical protein
MMNLREIAAKKLAEILLGQCEDEYRAMYHNGRLTGNWADIDNDKEQEHYYFHQGEEIRFLTENLEYEIKDTWGLEFKIYSYGRGGATFAPDGFSNCGNGHHFNRTLDPDKIVCEEDYQDPETYSDQECGDSWVDAHKTAKDHLAAFKFINERVRSAAAMDMAQWWAETKEACELTYEDDDQGDDEDVDFDEALTIIPQEGHYHESIRV